MMKTKHVLICTSMCVLVLGMRMLVLSSTSSSSSMLENQNQIAAYTFRYASAGSSLLPDTADITQNETLSVLPTAATKIETLPDNKATKPRQKPEPSTAQRQTRAIFYNIFIPPRHPIGGFRIVKEQLQQIVQAKGHEQSKIYYNVIGGLLRNNLTLCSDNGIEDNSRCQMLGHYSQAQEVVTLQAMYEYCVENPQNHVTYLHDKGSFHPKTGVDRSRRIGTKAALACLLDDGIGGAEPVTAVEKHTPTTNKSILQPPCNVCSDAFATHPHAHVPGNLFAAQCSYISQLVPPKEYEQGRRDICTFLYQHGISANPRLQTSFCPTPVLLDVLPLEGDNRITHDDSKNSSIHSINPFGFKKEDVGYGFGRYAMERWVASHPTLNVCTVFHNATKRDFQSGWEFWQPQSLPALKRSRRFSDAERNNLLFLVYEYAHLYGELDPRYRADYFCQTHFPPSNRACSLPSKPYRAALEMVANRSESDSTRS